MENKDIWYHIGYWITALLPVLIGVIFTVLFVRYAHKTYKESEDEE